MPSYSELSAVTTQHIERKAIADLIFRASPFLAKLLAKMLSYPGGTYAQYPFLYAKMPGGAYSQGEPFDISKPSMVDATAFEPRHNYRNVTEYMEEIEIFNTGNEAAFSLLDIHIRAAYSTLNEQLAVDVYRHGQASASTVSDDRQKYINGMSEAVNNGTDNSWDGNVFPAYGTKTRSAYSTQGPGLNGFIKFFGDSTGAAGSVTYPFMTELITQAGLRGRLPNLILTTPYGYAFMKERIQPFQRIEVTDPVWGMKTFSIDGVTVLPDPYAPSLITGRNDPITGNWLTSTFTSATSPTSQSNLPGATTITVGETGWVLNMDTWDVLIAQAKMFRFGWTGFIRPINATMVAGQVLASLTFKCGFPDMNAQFYGYSS